MSLAVFILVSREIKTSGVRELTRQRVEAPKYLSAHSSHGVLMWVLKAEPVQARKARL
jgi:hypothetical protein